MSRDINTGGGGFMEKEENKIFSVLWTNQVLLKPWTTVYVLKL